MNDDKPVRAKLLYGFAVTRPDWHAIIIVPQPRNALEAFWWAFLPYWHDVIYPSILFALAFTAFKYALFT